MDAIRKLHNRKAFTIVELVIVIAVIAILATVLAPTFSNIVSKAQDSAAKQEAKNAYTQYLIEQNGSAPEVMVYKHSTGKVVVLENGVPVNVYETEAEFFTAYQIAEFAMTAGTLYTTTGEACSNGGNNGENTPDDLTDWSGASAVFVGDSITAANQYTEKFYYEHLKDSLSFGSVQKQATSGSCISAKSDYGNGNSPLIGRYQSIPNGDLIVIFMGTNDFGHATPLGSITDTSDISFYGALNIIIPGIQATYPNSQIVMVTPLHRTRTTSSGMTSASDSTQNKAGATLADYVNAIKDICNKYDLYIIDLFSEAELDPNNETVKTTYFNSDGLHPNTAGHEKIAEILGEELRKIPRKESRGDTPETPEYIPDYTLRIGNKFGGENFANTPNRACTMKNLYLKAGTIIILKDNDTFNWAISPETSIDSVNENGQYLTSGWDEGAYRVISNDGWYGFTLVQTAKFDLGGADSNNLLDYFVITEQVKMENGNRFAPNASTVPTRLSSAINLYLPAGTVITFKTGTPATHWAISKATIDNPNYQDYKTNGWTSQTSFTVTEAGYYGFVLKNDSTALNSADYDLFDFFVISGYKD